MSYLCDLLDCMLTELPKQLVAGVRQARAGRRGCDVLCLTYVICLTVCLQNYLINRWQELGKTELPGEEVLVLAWLHSGIQVCVHLVLFVSIPFFFLFFLFFNLISIN